MNTALAVLHDQRHISYVGVMGPRLRGDDDYVVEANMGEFGIGQPVAREEDPYLVRGAGRYIDDVAPAGMARAYLLRATHAHARIVSVDVSAAKAAPGVLLVLTGSDPAVTALGLQR